MVRSACKPEFDNLMKIAEELKNESQKKIDNYKEKEKKEKEIMEKYDDEFKKMLEKENGKIEVY